MKQMLFFLQNLLLYVATIVALELAKEVTEGFSVATLSTSVQSMLLGLVTAVLIMKM